MQFIRYSIIHRVYRWIEKWIVQYKPRCVFAHLSKTVFELGVSNVLCFWTIGKVPSLKIQKNKGNCDWLWLCEVGFHLKFILSGVVHNSTLYIRSVQNTSGMEVWKISTFSSHTIITILFADTWYLHFSQISANAGKAYFCVCRWNTKNVDHLALQTRAWL